jgi:hypothetical protein
MTEYTLKLSKKCDILLQSIQKQIKNSIIKNNQITFMATSYITLNKYDKTKYDKYSSTLFLIDSLSKQQLFLEQNEYTFYTYSEKDIIVIDDILFLCIQPEFIKKIEEKQNIHFYSPFKKGEFGSPELMAITTIPSKLSYKTIYYSLSTLALFYLFESSTDLNLLESIKYTKLYYCLLKCLHKRVLLFI